MSGIIIQQLREATVAPDEDKAREAPKLDSVVEKERGVRNGNGEQIHLETELRLDAKGRPSVWQES